MGGDMGEGGTGTGGTNGGEVCRGLAFIVEGATEKVFYIEYLSQRCRGLGYGSRRTWVRRMTATGYRAETTGRSS